MAKAVDAGYSRFSVFLHWVCAFLLIVMFVTHAGGEQSTLHSIHLVAGPVVGLLLISWIVYRWKQGLPKNEEGDKSLTISLVTVWAFHLAIVILLVSGVLLPWVQGNPVHFLGFHISSPVAIDPLHLETIKRVHGIAAYALAPLLVAHIVFARNLEQMFRPEVDGH